MIYFFAGPDASAVLLYNKIGDLVTVNWGIRSRNFIVVVLITYLQFFSHFWEGIKVAKYYLKKMLWMKSTFSILGPKPLFECVAFRDNFCLLFFFHSSSNHHLAIVRWSIRWLDDDSFNTLWFRNKFIAKKCDRAKYI